MSNQRKLTKREIMAIAKIADRIDVLRSRFNEESGTDVELQVKGNGTVGGCLDCAAASLETILQEYF